VKDALPYSVTSELPHHHSTIWPNWQQTALDIKMVPLMVCLYPTSDTDPPVPTEETYLQTLICLFYSQTKSGGTGIPATGFGTIAA
jgi:hypothetical protein